MLTPNDKQYGYHVVANGRNWNYIKLITGHAARWSKHNLKGINFQFLEDRVRIVIKKDSPKGPQVAFLEGSNADEALYNLAYAIKSKTLRWRPDKFRTTRRD